MMKIFKLLAVIAVFLFFSACKSDKKKSDSTASDQQETNGFGDVEGGFEGVYYRFPSPEEMLNVINSEKLVFNPDLITPIQSADNFLSTKSQSLNLGVYIADMAYITLFKRTNEAYKYFQIIYKLSDKLRISAAFDPTLMTRMDNNLKNMDTLEILANEAYTDISDYLVRYEKERVFAVISIGGYVESLYLALNIVKEYDVNNEVVQRISDQKLVLENLIKYAETYQDDINVKESLEMIQPLRDIFSELEVKSSSTEVQKDDQGKLIVSGGNRIIITKNQFENLKKQTQKIRNKIVES